MDEAECENAGSAQSRYAFYVTNGLRDSFFGDHSSPEAAPTSKLRSPAFIARREYV